LWGVSFAESRLKLREDGGKDIENIKEKKRDEAVGVGELPPGGDPSPNLLEGSLKGFDTSTNKRSDREESSRLLQS